MATIHRRTPREPSMTERFAEEIGRNLGAGISSGYQQYQANKLRGQSDAAIKKKYGLDLSGFDPEIRKVAVESLFKQEEGKGKKLAELEDDHKTYDSLKGMFGPTFAELWKQSPTGGRTELVKQGLDAKMRGQDIEQTLSPYKEEIDRKASIPDQVGEHIFPKLSQEEGLTPKERIVKQKQVRDDNMPVFIESQKKLRSLAHEKDSLNVLESLNKSGKLPENIRIGLINPSTNAPYGVAQLLGIVNPETQRFVKTINDFTTQAKESYGARVTNFDLQQFMARLPTLMNTSEGRRQITEQMKIVNELNNLYESSLKKTLQHYGLGHVPYEKAVEVAENNIADREETLRQRFNQISNSLDQTTTESAERKSVSRGTKLTKDVAHKYYELAGKDRKKAMQMAKEDGYEE